MSLCSRLRESVGAGASDIDWLMFQPTERNVRSPLISLPLTEKRKERDRVRKHRSKKCQTKFKHPWLRRLTNRSPSVLMLPWQTVAVGSSGGQSLSDFNLYAGATQICQRKTFHSKNLSIELLCFNRMTPPTECYLCSQTCFNNTIWIIIENYHWPAFLRSLEIIRLPLLD